MTAVGYKPTWAGIVEAQPSPHELHALITPPELLHLTHTAAIGGTGRLSERVPIPKVMARRERLIDPVQSSPARIGSFRHGVVTCSCAKIPPR